ncbi:MAG: tetratricopeptide repeat protein [Candidatus Coatesbacteria bacterium]|nr:tetratricopeptide repeat protein [Candidatus Coatesbacteria bacterium]
MFVSRPVGPDEERIRVMRKLAVILITIAVAGLLFGCRPEPESYGDTPESHVATGHKYLDQRQYDKAIAAFERAIELDHRYAPAYSGIGFCYLQQSFDSTGESRLELLDMAQEKFKKAMGMDPDDVYGKIGNGLVHIEHGDLRQARLLFQAASHDDTEDPIAKMWWAIGAAQVGYFKEADYVLEEAMEMAPDNPRIQQAYDRLKLAERLMQGVEDEDYRRIAFLYNLGRADAAALFARELDLTRIERRNVTSYGGPGFTGPGEPETGAEEYYATDIAGHWALPEINLMIETGLMDTYPDGGFLPDAKMNRAEFAYLAAAVIAKVTGDTELLLRGMSGESQFKDVRADNFAYGAIIACTTRGILQADADGFFRPLDYISGTDAVNAVRTVETILAAY